MIKKSGRISEDPCSLSMNNILRVQVEYLHSLNVSITEAIVTMSHVRFNGNIYIPAQPDAAKHHISSFTHQCQCGSLTPRLEWNTLIRLTFRKSFINKM